VKIYEKKIKIYEKNNIEKCEAFQFYLVFPIINRMKHYFLDEEYTSYNFLFVSGASLLYREGFWSFSLTVFGFGFMMTSQIGL